jgi:GNAT superfamily N-acetyltransferase
LEPLVRHPELSFVPLPPERVPEASDLVERVFRRQVAPRFESQGVNEFLSYIAPEAMRGRLDGKHWSLVAETGTEIVGLIEVRGDDHISLFFVDSDWQGQGVGRRLWGMALQRCLQHDPSPAEITVHASPNAVPIYEELGFRATDLEQVVEGIHFVPMHFVISREEVER